MSDLISRQAAIDAVKDRYYKYDRFAKVEELVWAIETVPSAQPDEKKISDTLYNIYRNTSPHTSAEGVAAIKYYIAEIWREIYGEEGPGWMKK